MAERPPLPNGMVQQSPLVILGGAPQNGGKATPPNGMVQQSPLVILGCTPEWRKGHPQTKWSFWGAPQNGGNKDFLAQEQIGEDQIRDVIVQSWRKTIGEDGSTVPFNKS